MTARKPSTAPIARPSAYQLTGQDPQPARGHRDRAVQAHHAASPAKSEQQYRLLFDSMLNGFALQVVVNETGRPMDLKFLDVNPAFASFFSMPAEHIIGRTLRRSRTGSNNSGST